MARLIGEIPLPASAVSAGTTYNLWQGVAPANQRITISGLYVGQDYNTNGTPGLLSFYFSSAAMTGGSSATPVSIDQDDGETFQSVWRTLVTTGSPTLTLIRNCYVNPQVAVPEYFPLYEEITLKGGGILLVRFIPQVSGNTSGWIRIQE